MVSVSASGSIGRRFKSRRRETVSIERPSFRRDQKRNAEKSKPLNDIASLFIYLRSAVATNMLAR